MKKLEMTPEALSVLAQMLRKVEFFASLTVGQLETILPYIQLRSYDGGETVFRRGDPGDAFYIVYQGRLAVKVKKGLLSSAHTLSDLNPGDVFGEMALLSKEPRMATVTCGEPSRCFVLPAQDFDFVLKENPSFAARIKQVAARRKNSPTF